MLDVDVEIYINTRKIIKAECEILTFVDVIAGKLKIIL